MEEAQEQFMGLYKAIEAEFLKGYEPARPGQEMPNQKYPEHAIVVAKKRALDFDRKLKVGSFQNALDRLAMMAQTPEDHADFASLEHLPQYVEKFMLDKYPQRIALLSHMHSINPIEYEDSAHEAKWLVALGRGLEYCTNSLGAKYHSSIDIIDALEFGFFHDIGMADPTILQIIASGNKIDTDSRKLLGTHGSRGMSILRAVGYKTGPELETAVDFHPNPREDISGYNGIAAMVKLVESFCGIAFPNKQSGKEEATIVDKRKKTRLSWTNVFREVRKDIWTPEELSVRDRRTIFSALDGDIIAPKALKKRFLEAEVLAEYDLYMVPYIVLYALARPD